MLKRDRSSEDREFDRNLKTGIMRLGRTNPAEETPTPFPYVLAWDKQGRKGQRCKVIANNSRTVQVEFADGHKTVLNRMAIRRD